MMCGGIKYSTKGLHWPAQFTTASLVIMRRPCYQMQATKEQQWKNTRTDSMTIDEDVRYGRKTER